jgi:hypothetical protein
MFQANLHKNMMEKHDHNWFERTASGDVLKELWSVGQKFNAEELMELNNWDILSIAPLKENIMKYLSD